MTVLKRFDDALAPIKQAVLDTHARIGNSINDALRDGILCKASGKPFYNTSKFDFARLVADPDNIAENFYDYISGFSDNVKDILSNFDFTNELIKPFFLTFFCAEKRDKKIKLFLHFL